MVDILNAVAAIGWTVLGILFGVYSAIYSDKNEEKANHLEIMSVLYFAIAVITMK